MYHVYGVHIRLGFSACERGRQYAATRCPLVATTLISLSCCAHHCELSNRRSIILNCSVFSDLKQFASCSSIGEVSLLTVTCLLSAHCTVLQTEKFRGGRLLNRTTSTFFGSPTLGGGCSPPTRSVRHNIGLLDEQIKGYTYKYNQYYS